MEFSPDQPKYGVRMYFNIIRLCIFPFLNNIMEKSLEVKILDLLQFLWKVYIIYKFCFFKSK